VDSADITRKGGERKALVRRKRRRKKEGGYIDSASIKSVRVRSQGELEVSQHIEKIEVNNKREGKGHASGTQAISSGTMRGKGLVRVDPVTEEEGRRKSIEKG